MSQAEEMANGMDVRNAALEQLGYTVKEAEIITASAKAAGDKAATWAAKCAEQKPKISLTYSVLFGIGRAPSSSCRQNAKGRESAT